MGHHYMKSVSFSLEKILINLSNLLLNTVFSSFFNQDFILAEACNGKREERLFSNHNFLSRMVLDCYGLA